jgi:hypothetical protein
VEQDRTSAVLVYQFELEREASGELREAAVNLISGTKTKTGLKVKAILDTNYYETGP